jgi:hypothetical protein
LEYFWLIIFKSDGESRAKLSKQPGSLGCSFVAGRRVIFGVLPQGAAQVEITVESGDEIVAQVRSGVFLAEIPLLGIAIAVYKDVSGQITRVQPLPMLQTIQPPGIGRRFINWLQKLRRGSSLGDVITYGSTKK